jgi:hypothetical protein
VIEAKTSFLDSHIVIFTHLGGFKRARRMAILSASRLAAAAPAAPPPPAALLLLVEAERAEVVRSLHQEVT